MSLNLPQFCLVGRETGKKRKKLKLEIRDICRIVARDSFSVFWEKERNNVWGYWLVLILRLESGKVCDEGKDGETTAGNISKTSKTLRLVFLYIYICMDGRERGGNNKKERRVLLFFSSQIFVLGLIFFYKEKIVVYNTTLNHWKCAKEMLQ